MATDSMSDAGTLGVDSLPASGPDSRSRGFWSQIMLTGSVVLAFCAIWEFLSWLDPPFWPEILLSKPSEIFPAFFEAIQTSFVYWHFWVTLQETAIGFVIGAGGGFLLGTFVALLLTFRKAFYPVIILFQSTPRVALAPVFLAWFGFGILPKVALAATICFFPVLINTITGLTVIDENAGLLMRSLRATRWQTFRHLRLPSSAPTVFAGLKAAVTFALIGAIVGELSGTNEGAGHLIEKAAFQFRSDDVFAYLLMLSLMGLALFLLAGGLERRLLFWHVDVDQPT